MIRSIVIPSKLSFYHLETHLSSSKTKLISYFFISKWLDTSEIFNLHLFDLISFRDFVWYSQDLSNTLRTIFQNVLSILADVNLENSVKFQYVTFNNLSFSYSCKNMEFTFTPSFSFKPWFCVLDFLAFCANHDLDKYSVILPCITFQKLTN